ncbi:MAG: hypothetical protein ACXVRJ_09525 [Gaiellaceae bacterium]
MLFVGLGLAALLVYVVLDSSIPKATSVTLACIGVLPVTFFVYIGVGLTYWTLTGRTPPGRRMYARLAAVLDRRL